MNKWFFRVVYVLLIFLLAVFSTRCREGQNFDLLIRNGKIIDGTGNPWFYGDVGIKGDTILAVGHLEGRTARRIIDARNLVVAPGFIDIHTHCDLGLGSLPTNSNSNYLTQGVTTVVTGNCGSGTFEIADTKSRWEKQGIGTNAALQVGFGTVRKAILGEEGRAPTPEELGKMKSLVRKAMKEGAWGMSTGLMYIPDRYASTEELLELVKIVAEFDGIFNSHQRNEEERLVEAVKETIRIGEITGVSINAAHFKAAGKNNFGKLIEATRLINEARSKGIDMTADMYPYDKAATAPLSSIFNIPRGMKLLADLEIKIADEKTPDSEKAQLAGQAANELAKVLADPEKRQQIRKLTLEGDPEKVNWVVVEGWHNFAIVSAQKNTALIGKIFSDLAQEQGRDPFDLAADLFREEKNDIVISVCVMSEDDMKYALPQDWLMISSDGESVRFGEGLVHPRNYGSFCRVLGKYVRDEKVLTLEQAVRKMTSLPARLLRLKDRGLLLKGYKADIVLFDAEKVKDNATYLQPHQYSSGLEWVLVNGQPAIENGRLLNILPGKVLLRTENR